MRRSAPPGLLSSKTVKHFAAATVALTALLALFASGEDWGAKAQVGAVEAKNQLVATETEKLGTKKLAAKLKISEEIQASSFGNSDIGIPSGGGASYRPTRAQPIRQFTEVPPPSLPQTRGATITLTNVASEDLPGGGPKKKTTRAAPFRPDARQIDKIKGVSRLRTGGSTGSD